MVVLTLVMLVGLTAPLVAPHSPAEQDLEAVLQPPTRKHMLGTDELGRDLLSRIIFGARTSLTLGLVVVAIAAVTGTLLGLGAGYFGGVVDAVLMALTDIAMAFPGFLLALLVVSIIGAGLFQTMVAIGVAYIPRFIRIARASTLSARELEYVQAARAIGLNSVGIMVRHILPNLLGPITVQATLLSGAAILIAASLGFLGLGAQPPIAEWGNMISDARQYLRNAPHASTFPGLAILLVVLAINLVGDGLRDALDVRTD